MLPPPLPKSSTQRTEGGSHLLREDLGLLPRGEVTALVDSVVVEEVRIRLLRPALRSGIELVREDGHSGWELDALDVEERQLALPVEACRGDPRPGQPVVGDVVEDVVPREPPGIAGEGTGDELV